MYVAEVRSPGWKPTKRNTKEGGAAWHDNHGKPETSARVAPAPKASEVGRSSTRFPSAR